jgi:hypothetical protein
MIGAGLALPVEGGRGPLEAANPRVDRDEERLDERGGKGPNLGGKQVD